MKTTLLHIFVLFITFTACAQTDLNDKNRIIDETKNTESVDQVIAIDKVWAGHPVGFSLLTHQSRQYIAYYYANFAIGNYRFAQRKSTAEKPLSLTTGRTTGQTGIEKYRILTKSTYR